MRLDCPHCGLRDIREFSYKGDACLLERPGMEAPAQAHFAYVYLRDNPAGPHQELWAHDLGCRAWLCVTRDTTTHAVKAVKLARDVALARRPKEEAQP